MKQRQKEMQVFIEGRCSNHLRKIITDATYFYADLLIPRHKQCTLTINLVIKTRKVMKGDEATCMVAETNRRNDPIEFEIELNRNVNTKTMLYNLAHEMVHVKQFALRELNEEQSKWFGKRVDDTKVDYWDLPWEIEAYGRERGLFTRFVHKHKLDSIENEFLLS